MADEQTPVPAKNVIFMLPDGASASYMANYRYFKEDADGPVWEPLLKGMVQTDSADNPIPIRRLAPPLTPQVSRPAAGRWASMPRGPS